MNQKIPPTPQLIFSADKMSEAEVMVLLAFYLLPLEGSDEECTITPACQHVESNGEIIFPLAAFLAKQGWEQSERRANETWEGVYTKEGKRLIVTATPGDADVFIRIDRRLIRAECKKGPLAKVKGNPERSIIHWSSAS